MLTSKALAASSIEKPAARALPLMTVLVLRRLAVTRTLGSNVSRSVGLNVGNNKSRKVNDCEHNQKRPRVSSRPRRALTMSVATDRPVPRISPGFELSYKLERSDDSPTNQRDDIHGQENDNGKHNLDSKKEKVRKCFQLFADVKFNHLAALLTSFSVTLTRLTRFCNN